MQRSYSGDFAEELQAYKRELQKRAEKPRLDDALDERTSGQFGEIRRRMRDDDRSARARSEFLRDRYAQSAEDFNDDMRDTLERLQAVSDSVVSHVTIEYLIVKYSFSHRPRVFVPEQTVQAENQTTCDECSVEGQVGEENKT